ncbi:RagB/SusD family nutrient uptake outer membrane protein [Compostibacter hankyongensis]|uniref:RagB/SusD family nutrient uptake outer membrane protein n=1 Tax=Compostibacter hankyongensis TaxID=1007089 RepID=A0ABP8FT07_9BACT
MMKKLFSYTALLMLLLACSCSSVLDIAPQNIIQGKDVFSNESAIKAYLATLYNKIPIQDNNYQIPINAPNINYMSQLTGESLNNAYRWMNSVGDGTWLQWWGYDAVRDANEFLENISTAEFPDDQKKEWEGQVLFIRAYYYFELVKRYGGVPLITKVQNFNGSNLDSLQVPRNTEKEIYDFVASELDKAAQLMGETSAERGEANRYAAYALKARAMLYAAAEAEYGHVALNGLVGMPASEADHYWQAAYDAAKKIIDDKKYSLYAKQDDKAENFADLFLDQDNPETIFAEYYSYPDRVQSYDNRARPKPENGGHVCPTLEMAEAFEYTDGSDGKLKLTDSQGNPIEYKDPAALFAGKDPRFAATILYPFSSWPTGDVEVRAGIIDNGQTITTNDYNQLYQGMHIIGDHGIGGNLGNTTTGFYVRKYLDPAYTETDAAVSRGNDNPYIDMRYGEVLLNYAEAAIELGKVSDAAWAVNEIRGRAGIKLLGDGEVTRDRVRHERQVEMAFEGGRRYWDTRRWRLADKLINNTKFTALYPYYNFKDKAYIFKTLKVGYALTFYPKLYYERIPPAEISKDPKLIQNPNY